MHAVSVCWLNLSGKVIYAYSKSYKKSQDDIMEKFAYLFIHCDLLHIKLCYMKKEVFSLSLSEENDRLLLMSYTKKLYLVTAPQRIDIFTDFFLFSWMQTKWSSSVEDLGNRHKGQLVDGITYFYKYHQEENFNWLVTGNNRDQWLGVGNNGDKSEWWGIGNSDWE